MRNILATLFTLVLFSVSIQAGVIANWKVLSDNSGNATATSGLTTDNPTFGDATPGSDAMDGVGIAGRFGTTATPKSVTLDVGQTLTVSAMVTLTGGASSNAGAGYRFSVQNDGGQFALNDPDNWSGGWNHVLITGNTAGDGFYWARTNGSYMSTGSNAVRLADENSSGFFATSGTFDGDSTAPYLWTMSITRDSSTTVDLFSSIVGGDGNFSESYTLNNVATSLFTYTAVGIQTTGASNLDQLSIAKASYVPEPSTMILAGLGLAGVCLRRRRRA